jgi:hypothetical protein
MIAGERLSQPMSGQSPIPSDLLARRPFRWDCWDLLLVCIAVYLETTVGRLHTFFKPSLLMKPLGVFQDQNWFSSTENAKIKIEEWRIGYNEQRPHSALGNNPPRGFADNWELSRTAKKTAGILTYKVSKNGGRLSL